MYRCVLLLLTFFTFFANSQAQEAVPETETTIVEKASDKSIEKAKEKTILAKFNDKIGSILFYDVLQGEFVVDEKGRCTTSVAGEAGAETYIIKLPFIVAYLALGAILFTFIYTFINIRMFKHGIDVVRGKYDNPDDQGDISHFQALMSALSGTVGLGNIAGVAIAIYLGGAGAVFWMAALAIFGMAAKFSSSTLAQMYRKTNKDGSLSGGPMYYLDLGLKQMKLGILGKFLGVLYAVMIMLAAIGGGNMFQSNQTFAAIDKAFLQSDKPTGFSDMSEKHKKEYLAQVESDRKVNKNAVGIIMAFFVGLVVVGGIKRIGAATSKLIPLMCGIYILASLYVIFSNIEVVPGLITDIFTGAFSGKALFGGSLGALVVGFQRAAFSNEAGLGSASIVHAAAKTDEPVREGIVSMLGPVIDTIVVCSMTALVILITNMHMHPDVDQMAAEGGAVITAAAFGTISSWFPKVLTVCIILFAFSTMISWCYYGERGWIYLMDHFGVNKGVSSILAFRIIFVAFVWVGAVSNFTDVLNFTDLMILSLCFPNIIGSLILAPKVVKITKEYCRRYKAGEMKVYK